MALVEGGTPVCGVCDPGGNGIIDTCETCPADFDGDGDVDAADLAELLGAWGSCPDGCQEDLNFDCEVDAADLGLDPLRVNELLEEGRQKENDVDDPEDGEQD